MREVVRRERFTDQALPRQRDAPEQEAGALLWRVVNGGRGPIGYAERSLASRISALIVSGKSAVIIGPSCRASCSGPSISAA